MKNADLFKNTFGMYATEIWSMSEKEFLIWLNEDAKPKTGHWSRKIKVDAYDIAGVKTWGIKCQCDRCDFTTIVVEDFGYYKYCPNCGSAMKGE